MYEKIVDENPYETPMIIYPAVHYSMGGLWIDYELQTTIPGLFAIGEANFSDHGANRLGASALMQGLADGYFILPYTIQNYLADQIYLTKMPTELPDFVNSENDVRERLEKLLSVQGKRSVDFYHKALGKIMWDYVGMERNKTGLEKAIQQIHDLRKEFWNNVRVPGEINELNIELEKAGRVADFLELGELMATDALHREESCGGHFRKEYQTKDGEALRNDKDFAYVAAWEHKGVDQQPKLHKEQLTFENIEIKQRSYK